MSALMLLTALTAHAAEVQVDWEQPVKYHTESYMKVDNTIWVLSAKNLDARVVETITAFDLSCQGRPSGKNWAVDCAIDGATLRGVAELGDDQTKVEAIMDEWAAVLQESVVQLQVARDGRITAVDIEGPSKRGTRERDIHERMRWLVRGALAPLDVQVPKDSTAGAKPYKQKGSPLAYELPTNQGSSGGSVYKHTVAAAEGPLVTFTSEGEANIGVGDNFGYSSAITNMILTAEGRWDTAAGQLAWRELGITGIQPTREIVTGDGVDYVLSGWIGRINADGTVEGKDGPVSMTP